MTILWFVLILGVLVFVHELGHFLAARRAGVQVEEFGFGFPPRVWGFRRGQLVISFNAIPFGGFVRLQGEQGDPNRRPDSFSSATWPKQIVILAAGVIMNYLLAWLILSTIFGAGLPVQTDQLPASASRWVRQQHVEAVVSDNSPAAQGGLHTGDRVLSVNGQDFTNTQDVIRYTTDQHFPSLELVIIHDNARQTLHIQPQTTAANQPHYGFGLQSVGILRYPWYQAPLAGARSTAEITAQTFRGFGTLVRDLIVHGQVSRDVTGPIGIAVLTAQVSQLGPIALLQFVAVLSISLAVINFLPLPGLDGGRALFVVIGRMRRRPLNPRTENLIHAAGFYALILLVLVITVRDVRRFDILSRVSQLFHSSP